ncbi:formyltetrahydrofolate deformylase [Arthrobacter sp. Hiyo8]|nr:formyltetrahydrofolate deformylase [Arthrobacter sp. Hiyo8]
MAEEFGMKWQINPVGQKVRTLILGSKDAHCLNDLLFQQRSGTLPIEVPAIVSNHRDLEGLAEFYGIPFHHIPVTPDTKAQAEAKLLALIHEHGIELTVLARYMQVLSNELCSELNGKAINIHHSFLPSFKGAKPYHQAHARGVKIIGPLRTTSRRTSTRVRSSSRKSSGWTTHARPSNSCRWAATSRAARWHRLCSGTQSTASCSTAPAQWCSTRRPTQPAPHPTRRPTQLTRSCCRLEAS